VAGSHYGEVRSTVTSTPSTDTPFAPTPTPGPEYASPEYWAEVRAAGLPSPWRGALPNFISLVLTVTSVYFVGASSDLGPSGGIRLVLGLMSILTAHEMGHYVACRLYGVNATLPFFIPAPWAPIGPGLMWMPLSFIGTFGAVIRIKSPFPDRKALFDVGIAGPLAGFVIALPVLVLGILEARIVPASGDVSGVGLGEPLVFHWVAYWMLGAIPEGMTLSLGPLGLAAWFGLLVTALNLMPVGQLDGGHVAYALLRKRAFVLSRVVSVVALGLVYLRPLWLVWTVLLFVLGRRHPPTLADHRPVGRGRAVVGILGLVVFALCFTPSPILISWSEFIRAFRDATGF
jgi:membrane-associated protease RseP (regulator of RpoE activity)